MKHYQNRSLCPFSWWPMDFWKYRWVCLYLNFEMKWNNIGYTCFISGFFRLILYSWVIHFLHHSHCCRVFHGVNIAVYFICFIIDIWTVFVFCCLLCTVLVLYSLMCLLVNICMHFYCIYNTLYYIQYN